MTAQLGYVGRIEEKGNRRGRVDWIGNCFGVKMKEMDSTKRFLTKGSKDGMAIVGPRSGGKQR